MLHQVIKLVKDKHNAVQNSKVKKYKHKQSTWITLAKLVYNIRYRAKLRNELKMMYTDSHEYNNYDSCQLNDNAMLKNVSEQPKKCPMNRVLINSNIAPRKHVTL